MKYRIKTNGYKFIVVRKKSMFGIEEVAHHYGHLSPGWYSGQPSENAYLETLESALEFIAKEQELDVERLAPWKTITSENIEKLLGGEYELKP
jgi:hypothetical protein